MLKGTIQEWAEGPEAGHLLDTKDKRWDLYRDSFDHQYHFPRPGDKVTFEKDEEAERNVAIKVRKA